MLPAILPIFLITLSAVSTSALSSISFRRTLPMSLFILIALEYCIYITGVNILFIRSLYAGITLALFFCALLGLRKRKANRSVREYLASELSALLIFFILLVISIYLARDKKVCLWDELRLWGAYPKSLYYDPVLQLGNDSYIFRNMMSYRPAMPLFAWFLSAFSPTFNEETIFLAYSFFGVCTMLPISSLSRRPFDKGFFLSIAAILILPTLVFNSAAEDYACYNGSLFIDSRLGLCFGYALYLGGRNRGKGFELAELLLAVFTLSQLKDSGVFLALCCVLCWCVTCGLNGDKKRRGFMLFSFICGAAVILFSYLSWNSLIEKYQVANHLSMHLSKNLIFSFFLVIKHLLASDIFRLELAGLTLGLRTWIVLLALVFLRIILIKQHSKHLAALLCMDIFWAVGSVFFTLGYCAIFTDDILYEGSMPSALRYFSTLMLAALLELALFLADIYSQREALSPCRLCSPVSNKPACKVFSVGLSALFIVYMIIPALRHPRFFEEHLVFAGDNTAVILEGLDAQSESGDPTDCFFCSVSNEFQAAAVHHRTYYNLIGSGIRIKNFYDETNILPEHSDFDSAQQFWTYLQDGSYKLFYMYDVNEQFNALFGELFESGEARPFTLYEIAQGKLSPICALEDIST